MKPSKVLGCSPSQVKKFNEFHAKAGTGVHYSPDGAVNIPTPKAYDKLCALNGWQRTESND